MAPPARILLAFDYLDPVSYLVERSLEAVLAPHVRFDRLGVELAPPRSPPLDPDGPEWSGRLRTGEREGPPLGVTFAPPPLLPRTRKAHELAALARAEGCFDPVHAALFHACLIQGRDVGRVDELVRVAEAAGLDPGLARVSLDVDRFAQAVEGDRLEARVLDIQVIPTLLWDDGGVEGFLPPSRMRTTLPPGFVG